MNRYLKVEGDIIYPDNTMMTWGPFYFHSFDKAKSKMDEILEWITQWVNEKDPLLNIQPENVKKSINGQMMFNIKAWKDDLHLEDCKGIITVEDIFFEDEE